MIEHIKHTYQSIDAAAIDNGILHGLYTQDTLFIDPFHRLEGLPELERYFAQLYRNVRRVSFDYGDHGGDHNGLFLEWVMTLEHPRLKGGDPVKVAGVTHFTIRDGKICRHRDYFDSAQMLYENLPLLGTVIRKIKNRMGT